MNGYRLAIVTTGALLGALTMALAPAPTQAQSTIYGTTGDDEICLFFSPGVMHNVACVNGSLLGGSMTPIPISTPVTIIGNAGNDKITIASNSMTGTCTCSGCAGSMAVDSFVYGGGTVTVHGEWGDDEIAGGHGTNLFLGGYGHDHLRGHEGADTLYGEDGEDTVLDDPHSYAMGGTNDKLYGGDHADCMGDCTTTSPNVCSGGPSSSDGEISCSGCTSVEVFGVNCPATCPDEIYIEP